MRNSLHREIMREAAACSRMKPKKMDGSDKPPKAPRALSKRRLAKVAAVSGAKEGK